MTETNTGNEDGEHLGSRAIVRKALAELSNDFELRPVDELGQSLTTHEQIQATPDESTGPN